MCDTINLVQFSGRGLAPSMDRLRHRQCWRLLHAAYPSVPDVLIAMEPRLLNG